MGESVTHTLLVLSGVRRFMARCLHDKERHARTATSTRYPYSKFLAAFEIIMSSVFTAMVWYPNMSDGDKNWWNRSKRCKTKWQTKVKVPMGSHVSQRSSNHEGEGWLVKAGLQGRANHRWLHMGFLSLGGDESDRRRSRHANRSR